MTGNDLRDFLQSLDCRIATETLKFDVLRLSHVEDAGPGSLSWHRGGELASDFPGDVLIARSDASVDGVAKLVAYHDNPRMVLRKIITRYGFASSVLAKFTKAASANVHPTAVLGAAGQSYDKENGAWIPFPHAGGLRIGTNVDVGPCSTVMRGSIGDTVIDTGSKIGNGVNIGHDARIGKNVLVIAGALVAGWARIGDDAKIWQGAIIKNGIRIGKGAQVGMGAVVLKDVPPGEVWAGSPARKVG